MRTFRDAAGRTWTLAINLGTALLVRDRLGVDLLRPEEGDPPLITRLATDELLLGEVVAVLIEDQFEAAGVDAAEVRRAFDGEVLAAAADAFWAELEDFFRRRRRPDRQALVAKVRRTLAEAVEVAREEIERTEVDVRRVASTRGERCGGSPASSG